MTIPGQNPPTQALRTMAGMNIRNGKSAPQNIENAPRAAAAASTAATATE